MAEQTMTRAEHMAWAKQRALAYLPGDPAGALASFLSDIAKHPETNHPMSRQFTAMLMFGGHLETAEQVRKHIEGFN
jgi:hypothetical protein